MTALQRNATTAIEAAVACEDHSLEFADGAPVEEASELLKGLIKGLNDYGRGTTRHLKKYLESEGKEELMFLFSDLLENYQEDWKRAGLRESHVTDLLKTWKRPPPAPPAAAGPGEQKDPANDVTMFSDALVEAIKKLQSGERYVSLAKINWSNFEKFDETTSMSSYAELLLAKFKSTRIDTSQIKWDLADHLLPMKYRKGWKDWVQTHPHDSFETLFTEYAAYEDRWHDEVLVRDRTRLLFRGMTKKIQFNDYYLDFMKIQREGEKRYGWPPMSDHERFYKCLFVSHMNQNLWERVQANATKDPSKLTIDEVRIEVSKISKRSTHKQDVKSLNVMSETKQDSEWQTAKTPSKRRNRNKNRKKNGNQNKGKQNSGRNIPDHLRGICGFHLRGKCVKEDCRWSHVDVKKVRECEDFKSGQCNRKNCWFRHGKSVPWCSVNVLSKQEEDDDGGDGGFEGSGL
jgi:hypothetical protein